MSVWPLTFERPLDNELKEGREAMGARTDRLQRSGRVLPEWRRLRGGHVRRTDLTARHRRSAGSERSAPSYHRSSPYAATASRKPSAAWLAAVRPIRRLSLGERAELAPNRDLSGDW